MRQGRPALKGLWHAFDEAAFGQDRTLNLRESLPSAADARTRAESWLRMRQVMKSGEVLVITGRGNQSPNGIGVVREAVLALMPSLRRRGVVKSWREHTPGSIVVTLAPVASLLGAPKRNRERGSADSERSETSIPASLAALEPETLELLHRLAVRTIESLGVTNTESFVEDEMQAIFAKLSVTLPVSADREGTLRRAISSAIEDLEGSH
jgi:hypothetical protein